MDCHYFDPLGAKNTPETTGARRLSPQNSYRIEVFLRTAADSLTAAATKVQPLARVQRLVQENSKLIPRENTARI
jgi:hypothetical protein